MERPTFREWFEKSFASPEAVMVEYLHELEDCATAVGGSLPERFVQDTIYSDGHGNKRMRYIPNVRGANDQKQSSYAFLGVAENGDGTSVEIPIVIFQSFKISVAHVTWAPTKSLFRDFNKDRKIIKYGNNRSTTYSQEIEKAKAKREKAAAQLEQIKQQANDAAASLALQQLKSPFTATLENPSAPEYFAIEGLVVNSRSEFICTKSVRDSLYIQSKNCWMAISAAYPRDLIIPMYDIRTGKISNLQRITFKTKEKRFLPGGKMLFQCAVLSPRLPKGDSNRNKLIVTEGYKTARVIDHAKKGIVFCAFSANNVANIVNTLRKNYPNAEIYTATDNDVDGLKAQDHCQQNFGSLPIPAPVLFNGSDWADDAKRYGLEPSNEEFKRVFEEVRQLYLGKSQAS